MIQTKDDCLTFLAEARTALDELSLIDDQEKQFSQDEERFEKELEGERRAVGEKIRQTIKKRVEEIGSSYDKEITKGQEDLKRARSKREKAKSLGMKERIEEETIVLQDENKELHQTMKRIFQEKHVPGYCSSALYYSLYFPHWFRDFGVIVGGIIVFFLLIPYGTYYLIPNRNPIYLAGIYLLAILIFGGSYVMIGNRGKLRHLDTLKQGRLILDQIRNNKKKINVITSTIRKDRSESMYDLAKHDDEIAQAEQALSEVANKKKEALNNFETVTKTILSDEIENNSKEKIQDLLASYERAVAQRKEAEGKRKEKRLFVTDHYETYLGHEFLDSIKIGELTTLIQQGDAQNLSEAMTVYKERK